MVTLVADATGTASVTLPADPRVCVQAMIDDRGEARVSAVVAIDAAP